jgi:hypothetical protein
VQPPRLHIGIEGRTNAGEIALIAEHDLVENIAPLPALRAILTKATQILSLR